MTGFVGKILRENFGTVAAAAVVLLKRILLRPPPPQWPLYRNEVVEAAVAPVVAVAEVVVRWLSNRNDETETVVHEKWSSMRADLIVAEQSSQPRPSTEAAEGRPRMPPPPSKFSSYGCCYCVAV